MVSYTTGFLWAKPRAECYSTETERLAGGAGCFCLGLGRNCPLPKSKPAMTWRLGAVTWALQLSHRQSSWWCRIYDFRKEAKVHLSIVVLWFSARCPKELRVNYRRPSGRFSST